jgi:hypothetical protein
MGTVLDFMPEEQREEYSAMTGQLLFYVARKKDVDSLGKSRCVARGSCVETFAE